MIQYEQEHINNHRYFCPSFHPFTFSIQVEVLGYGGETFWYDGIISGKNDDGTYNINYTDGDTETHVKHGSIRVKISKNDEKEDEKTTDKADKKGSDGTLKLKQASSANR